MMVWTGNWLSTQSSVRILRKFGFFAQFLCVLRGKKPLRAADCVFSVTKLVTTQQITSDTNPQPATDTTRW